MNTAASFRAADARQTSGQTQNSNIAKLPANKAGGTAVKAFFESNKKSLMDVLPKHVNPDRMLNIAFGAMRTTPALMECTVQSLMGAVVACSQLGLEPNTPLGHCYLIPFNEKKPEGWKKNVQVVIGYRGLIDLARRSGQIESISAHAVHEHDEFDFQYGLEEVLIHKPDLLNQNRGKLIAFYAVAKLKDGGHVFEVMSNAEVQAIRDGSEGYRSAVKYNKVDKSPWTTHYEQMGRKTVVRRLAKYLPMSIELATAVVMDEIAERGASQGFESALDGVYTVDSGAELEGDDDASGPQPEEPEVAHEPKQEAQPKRTRKSPEPVQESQPEVSYEQIVNIFEAHQSLDDLDVAASLIQHLNDETQREALRNAYFDLRAKLEG